MQGYQLDSNNGTCLEICGDGIVINMECDDGNIISGDGCSRYC
jgi:cysteine-rich repeat protein